MKFLKNLGVALFAFIFFISLTLFGFAFMVKSTALNPDFVTAEIDKLDIPALVEEVVQVQPSSEGPDLNQILSTALPKLEPQIKAQADTAVHSVYDYLLGNKPEPELASTLRNTFLSTDFVTSLLSSIDVAPFLAPAISEQLAGSLPIQVPELDKYVEEALVAAEPSLKQQVVAASGPVFDYLLGTSNTLNASISLETALSSLKGVLRQAFIDSPPAGLTITFAGIQIPVSEIPQGQRGAAFDAYYPTIVSGIPTTFPIDQSVISPQARADFSKSITEAEDSLRQARQYVASFQQAYILLIVIMALMLLGIILILRDVKAITGRLGIPLLTTGAIEFASAWVINYLVSTGKIPLPQTTGALETWALQFVNDLVRPLQTFGIAILIVGAVLTVVSFVYKPRQPEPPPPA